jgi:hypothetical protein
MVHWSVVFVLGWFAFVTSWLGRTRSERPGWCWPVRGDGAMLQLLASSMALA